MHSIFPRKILIFMLLFLAGVLLTACNEQNSVGVTQAPKVRYLELEGKQLTLTKELPGRVSAFMVSEVRPQVSGIILERLFDEGADVEEGQVLYQIDPSLFQATYNNAKANLARAESSLVSARLLANRYASIVKDNAVSKQEYDDAVAAHGAAKAEVEAARAALETASINLGYTKVTAPVSGRIGRSYVTPGALVTQNQGDPLATVQQLKYVYVDVTQSNTELLRLRRAFNAGQLSKSGPDSAKVKLKLEDGSAYARNIEEKGEPDWIKGELLFSDVTIEQSTGMVSLRARFDNHENILLPGMYVRAVIEEGVQESAILAPQKSVQRDTRGRPFVYVLSKEHPVRATGADGEQTETISIAGAGQYFVTQRMVEIARDYQNQWLIRSGLDAGDLLLVDGLQKARPGQLVAGIELAPDNSGSLAEKSEASAPVSGLSTPASAEAAADQEQAG